MPEIGECYTIAEKVPELHTVTPARISQRFYKYINPKKNVSDLVKQEFILSKPFAYGKSIWFPVKQGKNKGYLISQLGMTGSWFVGESGRTTKNDHFTISNEDTTLRYSDPRMFGSLNLFWQDLNESDDELRERIIKHYRWGLDPHQASVTSLLKVLSKWQKSSKNIKTLLLDQNIIFGIGNYLASEILYAAKISPYTLGKDLTNDNLKTLIKEMKRIVKIAIKTGGYSFAAGYYHPDGSVGKMVKFIKVYEQAGKTCPNCGGIIKKDFINNRSTYFCPKCQGVKK
jgi:formamidopyrimidine-DNA glycosylase